MIEVPRAILNQLDACPHPLLFVTVSGAHLYGFESADSDWDLRGAHIAQLEDVLSLNPGRETFEVLDKDAPIESDIVTHDVRKFFTMLLKSNGYVLEQVFSPIVVAALPEFEEIKEAANRCICKRHRHHFFHFGIDQWKTVTGKSEPTVKGVLYTYRPLLAGIHLMRTGTVESNLRVLNEEFKVSGIGDLIARKLAGEEKGTIDPKELGYHEKQVQELCAMLDDARESSHLPEEPDAFDALNELLIRLRLDHAVTTRTP